MQHACAVLYCHFVLLSVACLSYIFLCCIINGTLLTGNKLLNTECVFLIFYNFFRKKIPHS